MLTESASYIAQDCEAGRRQVSVEDIINMMSFFIFMVKAMPITGQLKTADRVDCFLFYINCKNVRS